MEEWINSSDCEGTDDIEMIVDKEQVSVVDNGNVSGAERPVVVSSATARPLVKVPHFMATRKRKIQEQSNCVQDIFEIFKLQMLERQADKKEAEERRMKEREAAERQREEDRQ